MISVQQHITPKSAGYSLPVRSGFLRRTYTWGNHAVTAGECAECCKKRLQHKAAGHGEETAMRSIAHTHKALRSSGQPLAPATRAFMESRFGHDFSDVRVHAGEQAAKGARAVNALAYTAGHDIVFAENRYAPDTAVGRRLLAHELTHVVQQSGRLSGGRLAINSAGDAHEREADAVAARIMAGSSAGPVGTAAPPLLQRQTPENDPEKKPAEQKEAGEVIAEGLKTVAEQAADENPQVKKVIIEPLKGKLKGEWNRLRTGEKATVIGFGAATLGMAGGAMLSDPTGRKQLEGVNLAAPLTLIPYMPLSSFKYRLPSGDSPDKRLFKFETGFKADDLINLRTERRGLPRMSLSVNLQWGYDPTTERLNVLGGDASLGLVPGLSLSAGAYKDVLRPSPTFIGPEGQMTQSKKSIPEFEKPQPIPDVRIMLTVDLLKFKPGDLAQQIKNFF
jgi:hypothetical protein